MRKLAALLAFVLPVLASAQPAPRPGGYDPYARAEPPRDSWYIGFGLGGGSGSITDPDGRWTFDEMAVDDPMTGFLNLRAGATLSPRLLLGGELGFLRSSASASGADSTLGISTLSAVATYFPFGRGLSLRGGLGFARYTEEYSGLDVYGDSNYDRDGVNALVGIGYAWWLGRSFNLSLNFDLAAQRYGSASAASYDVESSRYGVLYVGFDWY